jgi:hypothetical protein
MKRLIIPIILLVWANLVHGEPSDEETRDRETREKLYERMAGTNFATYYLIQQSELPAKDKKDWMATGAQAAFYYWATTRKGGEPKSEIVDTHIALFYEGAVESKMTDAFSDPLYRMSSSEPERTGLPGFPTISQADYIEYVSEFNDYLKAILKERRQHPKE